MEDEKYTRRTWTKEEEDFLEKYWGHRTAKNIAASLNRSKRSVERKASKMALGSRYTFNTLLTLAQTAELFGVNKQTILSWGNTHQFPVKHRRTETGNKILYTISMDKILKWMEEHQSVWNSRKINSYAFGKEPVWLKEKREYDMMNADKAPRRRYTDREDSILKEMLRRGCSYAEVGAYLNRSPSSISSRHTKLNTKRWKRKNFSPDEEKAVIELRVMGKSFKEIAALLNRKTDSVSKKYHALEKKMQEERRYLQ